MTGWSNNPRNKPPEIPSKADSAEIPKVAFEQTWVNDAVRRIKEKLTQQGKPEYSYSKLIEAVIDDASSGTSTGQRMYSDPKTGEEGLDYKLTLNAKIKQLSDEKPKLPGTKKPQSLSPEDAQRIIDIAIIKVARDTFFINGGEITTEFAFGKKRSTEGLFNEVKTMAFKIMKEIVSDERIQSFQQFQNSLKRQEAVGKTGVFIV